MSARFVQATDLAFKYGYAGVKVCASLTRACLGYRPPNIWQRQEHFVDWAEFNQKSKKMQMCPCRSFSVVRVLG